MQLKAPFIITSRLLAGVKVGDGTISITFDGETREGRAHYKYFIDTPTIEFSASDLKSGVGGGSLQEGMGSLLAFLGAAAESYHYRGNQWTGDPDDNCSMFPKEVTEWAYQHSDEIDGLRFEIEETPELITD